MGEHGARKHAKFAMSAASRWLACPGYASWAADHPQPPSGPAAIEGTKAHEALETFLKTETISPDSERFRRGIAMVREVVDEWFAEWPEHTADTAIECTRDFPQNVVPAEDCGGTYDIRLRSPNNFRGAIIDYKNGRHEVKADGDQLIGYAIMEFLNDPEIEVVDLIVVQPNKPFGDLIVRATLDKVELFEHWVRFVEGLKAASAPDAPFIAGSHCGWCHNFDCPARQRAAAEALPVPSGFDLIQAGEPMTFPDVSEVSDEVLTRVFRAKEIFSQYLRDVESEIGRRLAAGKPVQGVKLVEAQASRSWDPSTTPEDLLLLAPGQVLLEDVSTRKLIGITEAEALFARKAQEGLTGKAERKAAKDETMAALARLMTKKSSGALKLVLSTDPRPEANRVVRDLRDVDVDVFDN